MVDNVLGDLWSIGSPSPRASTLEGHGTPAMLFLMQGVSGELLPDGIGEIPAVLKLAIEGGWFVGSLFPKLKITHQWLPP